MSMKIINFVHAACFAMGATGALAHGIHPHNVQIGPEIRIGSGEATVGGAGIKDGKVAVPTIDQVIDSAIASSLPLMLLSDKDKAAAREAIKAGGLVLGVAADPILGMFIISVLNSKGEPQDKMVRTVNAPPTGKSWTFQAKCIVQQGGGLFTAMFNTDPPDIMTAAYGDTINLKAGVCAEYQDKSVTAVTMKLTGRLDEPAAKPPEYLHYLMGRPL